MNRDFSATHVKIMIRTETEDGYPPEAWESIWATPSANGYFRIDNIPFYAKNISCDDIVEANLVNGEFIYVRVIQESDNSTIRVVVYNLEEEDTIRRELINLGCSIEGSGTDGLIALNVPKDNVRQVLEFLEILFKNEQIDFEEGAVRE